MTQSTYTPAALRIAATYPATDGSCPEQVEVEFGPDTPVSPELVERLIGALAQVPTARFHRETQTSQQYPSPYEPPH